MIKKKIIKKKLPDGTLYTFRVMATVYNDKGMFIMADEFPWNYDLGRPSKISLKRHIEKFETEKGKGMRSVYDAACFDIKAKDIIYRM